MPPFVKNITPLQWIGIVLLINSVLTSSVNEMTDLLGSVWAKHAVSLATIGSGICGGLITMFGGIGTQVRNVMAMPGVQTIQVNSHAGATLAEIAVDNDAPKVQAMPGAETAIAATAKGI